MTVIDKREEIAKAKREELAKFLGSLKLPETLDMKAWKTEPEASEKGGGG